MKNSLNIASSYIILWLLFDWVSLFYPGSFLSRSLLITILLISFYYLFHVISTNKVSVLFKSILVLLAMFSLYGIMLMNSSIISVKGVKVSTISYFTSIFSSFLPIFAFYSIFKDGVFSKKLIFYLLIVYVIYITYSYFLLEASILSRINRDETTNNKGYSFLMLIPLILVYDKKKIFQFLLLTYCLVYIVSSMKRGAIICGLLCYIWFVIITLGNASSGKKTVYLLLSAIIIIIVYHTINDMLVSSDYFNKRFEASMEGDVSGRDFYYSRVWYEFNYNSNLLQLLFGHGTYSTLTLMGNSAHSDWLELLYCNGLFGVVIYLYYWIALFSTWRKTRKDKIINGIIGMYIIVFFTRSIFSMSYSLIPEYSNLALGYALATAEQKCKT